MALPTHTRTISPDPVPAAGVPWRIWPPGTQLCAVSQSSHLTLSSEVEDMGNSPPQEAPEDQMTSACVSYRQDAGFWEPSRNGLGHDPEGDETL